MKTLLLLLVLLSGVACATTCDFYASQNNPTGTGALQVTRKLSITANVTCTVYYQMSGGWGSLTVGPSVPVLLTVYNQANGILTYSGLSSTNSPVTATSNTVNSTQLFSWTSGHAVTFSVAQTIPSATCSVSYSTSQSATTFTDLPLSVALTYNSTNYVATDPLGIHNGVTTLAINNESGHAATVPWGTGTITLATGMNYLGYDGPLNSLGIPVVAPTDFGATATAFIGSDGGNYVAQSLVSAGLSDTEVKWGNAMTANSSVPGATNDAIQVLSGSGGAGSTVIITRPDGGHIITTLPTIPGSVPQTTGSGANLFDPTQPPPAIPGGTTTNTSGNQIVNGTTTTTPTNVIGGSASSSSSSGGGGSPSDPGDPTTYPSGDYVSDTTLGTTVSGQSENTISGIMGDGSAFMPSARLKTGLTSLGTAWNNFGNAFGNGNTMGNGLTQGLTAPGGDDFSDFDVPVGHGVVGHVHLPLDHWAIPYFRLACCFALYMSVIWAVFRIIYPFA